METFAFLIIALFGAVVFYRWLSGRFATPKAIVRSLLRRYHMLEKTGLPEVECLFRLVSTRRGWKKLPERFLMELVARLDSKEDVMRFVSLAEGYRLDRTHLPGLAGKEPVDDAMTKVAGLLGRQGNQLQAEGRLKQAEFVQRLALRLQPNKYFTTLPLAATYYEMERYSEALPLFEQGLAQLRRLEGGFAAEKSVPAEADWLGPDSKISEMKESCQKMYQVCVKRKRKK